MPPPEDSDPDGPALVRAGCESLRIAADCFDESGIGGKLTDAIRSMADSLEDALP